MPEQPFILIENNKKRESRGADFPFGLQHGYTEANSTLSNSSNTTYLTALTLTTPVVPAGNYRIDWSFLYTTSNTSTEIEARILVDGVEVWRMIEDADASHHRQPGMGFKVVNLSNASHTIEIEFKVSSGSSATMYDRNLAIQRWD